MARRKRPERYNGKMTQVSIPDNMRLFIQSKKLGDEPLYEVIDRIINGFYGGDIGALSEQYRIACESVKKWQSRALEAEKKLEVVRQTTLIQT
jgi:hypothetical protein